MSHDTAPLNQITLLPFVRGDTWDGIMLIGPVTFNGEPPPATLASVLINFRKAWNDVVPAYVLSTDPLEGQGTIIITSASLWTMNVPTQALPLRAGTWKYDVQLTDSNGVVFTPLGGTIAVIKDITRS